MRLPLVSVCIVTYNHKRYIRDCIMSVVSQSSDVSLEILVGDDSSEDGTEKIVESLAEKYPNLIRLFRHEKRLGYGSRNYQLLLKKARGKYIAHLDGDDFWLPSKLIRQINFLKDHPDCPAVYSNWLVIDDDGLPLGFFNNSQPVRFGLDAVIYRGNFLNHSSMLYRAHLRKNIIELKAPFLDYKIHLNHAQSGALGYLNQTLVVYRVRSTSTLRWRNNLTRHLYWEAIISTPRSLIRKNSIANGMSEFARSVFFRFIKTKKISLLIDWFPVVIAASPVGPVKMYLLITIAVIRVGLQELSSIIGNLFNRNNLKIIYRR